MKTDDYKINVDLTRQVLQLLGTAGVMREYPVSTGKNGIGEKLDSGCTPRGRHSIAEMIGAGCASDTVFVGRRPTGEIYSAELHLQFPERDWILTRIIWLQGEEPGVNRDGLVDTYSRYIYIHGTPDYVKMGKPGLSRLHTYAQSRRGRVVRAGCGRV